MLRTFLLCVVLAAVAACVGCQTTPAADASKKFILGDGTGFIAPHAGDEP